MQIPATVIKELRERVGAGVMDCRNALIEAEGDMGKAVEILRERGLAKAAKKAERVTRDGRIECYVHTGGRIGAMLEINCETDFVARTDDFKALAHDIALQVVAMCPKYVSAEDMPQECSDDASLICLLSQPFIRDASKTVGDVIKEVTAKVGENIRVRRFVRFELGD